MTGAVMMVPVIAQVVSEQKVMVMNIVLFGATGMVGQGVLRECLAAADVDHMLTVGRAATGHQDAHLRELVHPDLFDLEARKEELRGFDACFFCLGVSS